MNTQDIFQPLISFKEQLTLSPVITYKESFYYESVIVCGMGGSALAAQITKLLFPDIAITLHNTYGLPALYNRETTLIILNSYSGDTEEIIEGYERAKKDNAHMLCISKGGKLLQLAEQDRVPHIILPEIGVEPRFSLGHQIIALLTALGETEKIARLVRELDNLQINQLIETTAVYADQLHATYPVLYASQNLFPVAYLIKAAINEGAKQPCFVHSIPEADHNEIQSFVRDTSNESKSFSFLFLESSYDHVRISKRFKVMKELYEQENFKVLTSTYNHTSILSIFEAIISGYALAIHLATLRQADPYKTPFIKLFKEKMSQ